MTQLDEELYNSIREQDQIYSTYWDEVEASLIASYGMYEKTEYDQWLESEDSAQYKGKQVAYVFGKGVIASANLMEELADIMLENFPDREDAIIFEVPED